jgi:Uma2 family endonuclease
MTSYPPIDSGLEVDRRFPDSDGQPMADNTEQFQWIVLIKENLEVLFADDPNVFVAGDLLWYPVPSQIVSPTAPDVMVAFGRPKGRRGSYKQWQEDDIAPQVVFEILSPSNTPEKMDLKLEFYDTYGIEEYYLYDPATFRLEGWIRQGEHLNKLWQMNDWVSPRLGIRFDTSQRELVLYRPDGQRFLTTIEREQQMTQERQRTEQERQRAEQAQQKAEQLAAYLRSIGVDPDNLPTERSDSLNPNPPSP